MKVLVISLGCDKNLTDTETMLGILSEAGHTFTDDENEAEAVLVNTCCFIGDAKEESICTILEMAEKKKEGKIKALLVAGCLAQRYKEEIQKEIPEVDALIGTMATDEIAHALSLALDQKPQNFFKALDGALVCGKKRILTTGGHYAYLKIAEGCDKHCTYCIIPKVRGPYRSVPMEILEKEAYELAQAGVKELILVAQETTVYGVDLYGKKSLSKLLKRLCKIPGLFWIRLLYCYPEEIDEELIQTIKTEEKICHYLDIPIQHGCDEVLKRMGRYATRQTIQDKIALLRREIPDICLRTTIITGFPGETEEEFAECRKFVEECRFDRLGVFPYSKEEDTPAYKMKGQVPAKLKKARYKELMELQQKIAFEKASDMVGRILYVLVEGKICDEDAYITRTYKDAPGVDGYLFLHTSAQLMTGDIVRVQVTDCNEYDLIGEIDHEFTE